VDGQGVESERRAPGPDRQAGRLHGHDERAQALPRRFIALDRSDHDQPFREGQIGDERLHR
jgi:hypothetical protein